MSTTVLYRQLDAGVDVEVIGSAKTLTQGDSGKVFTLVTSGTDGAAITLPALRSGFYAKFITGAAFATTAWTIVCPSAIGQGGAIVNSVFVPAVNETTITVAAAAETVGDWIEVTCDGTNYYINGVGAAAGAYTFA
jgi:hypothetical protein